MFAATPYRGGLPTLISWNCCLLPIDRLRVAKTVGEVSKKAVRTKEEWASSSAMLSSRGFSHWVFPRRSRTPRCWNPIRLNEPGDGRQVVGEGMSGPKFFEPLSHNTEPFRVTWLGRLRSPAHEQFVCGPKLLRDLAQLLVVERPTTRRILLLLNRPTAECRNKVHQQIRCSGC